MKPGWQIREKAQARLVAAALLSALALSGCAHHWVRTDGVPVNKTKQQATLAQCKGEGATAVAGANIHGIERTDNEKAVTEACMARHGYTSK
jgi:putative hemolysin